MQEIITDLQIKYEVNLVSPSVDRKLLHMFRCDCILEDALQQASKTKFKHNCILSAEGSIAAGLEDVLTFFTGADQVQPLGFLKPPQLHFLHDKKCTFATALVLSLPTCHSAYEDFQEKMILSFRVHGGFGGGGV